MLKNGPERYRPELDGLRGISILLVCVHHIYQPLAPAGFLGVDVFFVISGFLITSLLAEEWNQKGSISLKNFYIRRALRLMPAVFSLILILGLVTFVVDKKTVDQIYTGIWLTISYVSNWFFAFGYYLTSNPLSITWSLAVEEQFYLTWPLFLVLALRINLNRTWILCLLTLLIIVIPLHGRMLLLKGADVHRLYYGSDTRAGGLPIGCLAGLLVTWGLLPKSNLFKSCMKFLAVAGAVFFGYLISFPSWTKLFIFKYGGFSLLSLCMGICIIVITAFPSNFVLLILRFKPLACIGRISYGIYLWHWTVCWFIFQKKALGPGIAYSKQLAVTVILTLLLPTLSYHLVEKPFLRWKKQFG